MNRRIVVTGIGMVSPVGNSRAETWQSLLEGKSGISLIEAFDTTDYSVKISAEVKDFDPCLIQDRKEARKTDRFVQFAISASEDALADAGLLEDKPDPDRTGVVIGTGIGGMNTFEKNHKALIAKGPGRVSPFFIPMMIGDIASGQVSMRYNFRGPNFSVQSACATGAHAIADAAVQIKIGRADIMVCGGSEATVCPMAVAGFGNMKALSTRNDDPAGASRPFDGERDGFVLGEGAGILVLEEYEHAKARGAKIYAEVMGAGLTADAHHITAPHPEGLGAINAMKMALREGGIEREQVGYVNAHGTSTPFNDRTETLALRSFFGDHARNLKISSTKSMTGHLLGAAGGLEAGVTCLSLAAGRFAPTINQETPDPDCDLDYIPNKAIESDIEFAISTSLGFGGHNIVLLLGKDPGQR
ncbi:MAG: beta-ketoacyl-ACP synthase II [bacterium]|nr:beta-ketoacyl-ACP synthase II [bacterium]